MCTVIRVVFWLIAIISQTSERQGRNRKEGEKNGVGGKGSKIK